MLLPEPLPLLPALHAVLFDLDGTLVETHINFPAMTQAMLKRAAAADVHESALENLDILTIVEHASADIARRGGDGSAYRQACFSELEALEVAGCANPVLLPGTRELLQLLNGHGIKIGIVTRNCRRVSLALVARYGLPHDVLLTRDDVLLAKPHPEHLWDALRALGCSPSASAMAGDHWMDIQAGKSAHCIFTLGVLGAHNKDWFAPCPPDKIVCDLSTAAPLLLSGVHETLV